MRVNLFSQSGGQNNGLQPSLSATITGALILVGNPNSPLEAAPKQYVDNAINSLNAANIKTGTLGIGRLPAFTGDATSATGSGSFILSNSGVMPGTYTKITVDSKGRVLTGAQLTIADIPPFDWSKVNTGLPKTVDGYGITDALKADGSTITGNLSLNIDPTSSLHAATKQYVDSLGGNGASITTGTVTRRPTSATPSGFLRANGGKLSKTTYSALFSVIQEPYVTRATVGPNNYSAVGGGQPWCQQFVFNNDQGNNLTGWTKEPAALTQASAAQVVVTKNRVYVIGSDNSTDGTFVYTAYINADGTLGAFTMATALPVNIGAAQAFVTENRVYLAGGRNGSVYSAAVYTAVINADGSLGTWTATASLPGPLAQSQVVVTKSRVYLLGGVNGSGSYVNTVYSAAVNNDGTLGVWAIDTSLPVPLYGAQAVITNNRVYLLGGHTDTAMSATIYTASINSNGIIGAWTVSGAMPVAIGIGCAVVIKNRIYYFGGLTAAAYVNTIYTCPINADGSLGAWTGAGTLTDNLASSQAIVTSNYVYLLGGFTGSFYFPTPCRASISGGTNDYTSFYDGTLNKFDGSDPSGSFVVSNTYDSTQAQVMPGSGQPWRQQYYVNTQQSADLSGWTGGGNLPTTVTNPVVFVTKNRVYVYGGDSNSTPYATGYTSGIDANGLLTGWSTAPNNLPAATSYTSAIVIRNRVYIFNSYNGSGATNVIYSAVINADGTVGTWSSIGTTPFNGYSSAVFVTTNRIYLVGGTFSTTTYTCVVNADGSLGAWTTGPAFPISVSFPTHIVTRNRVYIFGGNVSGGSSVSSGVYTAVINADGTLGAWSAAASLPVNIAQGSVYATSSRIWLVGYWNASTSTVNTTYTAPINADGTIGTWAASTLTPANVYGVGLFATKTRMFIVGGATNSSAGSTVTNGVSCVALTGGVSDYTAYYDGTITPTDTTQFSLPDLSAQETTSEFYFVKT